ncbi:MAG: hypothetical protein AB1330_01875 [Bacillota bacterium]
MPELQVKDRTPYRPPSPAEWKYVCRLRDRVAPKLFNIARDISKAERHSSRGAAYSAATSLLMRKYGLKRIEALVVVEYLYLDPKFMMRDERFRLQRKYFKIIGEDVPDALRWLSAHRLVTYRKWK